jgi:UDP-galactopyranose mutase
MPDPRDQRSIPFPRFGFYGVIDERLDIELLSTLAEWRPFWQFILVGPVVKIDPAILPRKENIHYLGAKQYRDLPKYLAGWDVAMMPFALNASTKFISPTKTPEYLAGGKRVISPSIDDVVTPYGSKGLVAIADTPEQFIHEADEILHEGASDEWLEKVDAFLVDLSWDKTVQEMKTLIDRGLAEKNYIPSEKSKMYV